MGWRPRAAVGQGIWGEPGATGGVCGACCCGARRAGAREEAGLQRHGLSLSRKARSGRRGPGAPRESKARRQLGSRAQGGGCSDGPARTQVNTAAAEVLYTLIRDWAQLDAGSTVLDVCCGTGTIGLALARVSPPTLLLSSPFLSVVRPPPHTSPSFAAPGGPGWAVISPSCPCSRR